MQSWDLKGASKIVRAFRKRYYRLVKDILREGRMFIPCYAGYASCQISPEGDLWACCMRAEVMGNLRETGYDFNKVWFSENARSGAKSNQRQKLLLPPCQCKLYQHAFFPKTSLK